MSAKITTRQQAWAEQFRKTLKEILPSPEPEPTPTTEITASPTTINAASLYITESGTYDNTVTIKLKYDADNYDCKAQGAIPYTVADTDAGTEEQLVYFSGAGSGADFQIYRAKITQPTDTSNTLEITFTITNMQDETDTASTTITITGSAASAYTFERDW